MPKQRLRRSELHEIFIPKPYKQDAKMTEPEVSKT